MLIKINTLLIAMLVIALFLGSFMSVTAEPPTTSHTETGPAESEPPAIFDEHTFLHDIPPEGNPAEDMLTLDIDIDEPAPTETKPAFLSLESAQLAPMSNVIVPVAPLVNITVSDEAALRKAITDADDNAPYHIRLDANIHLTGSALAIPANKNIWLTGAILVAGRVFPVSVIGAHNQTTVTIAANAVLNIDGVSITHANGINEEGVMVTSRRGRGVTVNGTLNLVSGGITHNRFVGNGGGVSINSTGIFNMYGGNISYNYANSDTSTDPATINWGGGVYVSGGVFNLYGGEIVHNRATAAGGGVRVQSGHFNMHNGYIYDNWSSTSSGGGVSSNATSRMYGGGIQENGLNRDNETTPVTTTAGGGIGVVGGTFTMLGGEVSNNYSGSSGGGGVYISGGTFRLAAEDGYDGGSIAANETRGPGGGIRNNGGTLQITGGNIIGNYAGGGVDLAHDSGRNGGGIVGAISGTMANVKISDNKCTGSGGGISTANALTADRVEITGNFAGATGGGIRSSGTLTLSNSSISENTARSSGGGIYKSAGSTVLNSSAVSLNNSYNDLVHEVDDDGNPLSSSAYEGGHGGGIYQGGGSSIRLTHTELEDNIAGRSGGGLYSTGSVTLTDSSVSQNVAEGWNINTGEYTGAGGGLRAVDATVTVNNSVIEGNRSNKGGGIYANSTVTVTSGTISKNTAFLNGGGIWVTDTTSNLTRARIAAGVTFSGNLASNGGPYPRRPADITTYNNNIGSSGTGVTWTYPWSQGYNNHDIAYVNGEEITSPVHRVTVNSSWATGQWPHSIHSLSGTGDYIFGESIVQIDAGSRTGYSFSGWTVNSGGASLANPNSAVTTFPMADSSVTVTANWTANSYTVTLDRQGGSGGTASVTAVFDSNMPAMTRPTRTGYTFGGYWTGAGGTGTMYYTNTGASARAWNLPSDTTLYARWTASTYTITYDTNGGTGSMAQTTATYDASVSLRANSFTRTGYTFAGWATSTAGPVAYQDLYSFTPYKIASGLSLFAVWTANTYTVTYNDNGGFGTMGEGTATFDSPFTIAANAFARPGFQFRGWNTASNGLGTAYEPDHAFSPWGMTSNLSLYAQWDVWVTVSLDVRKDGEPWDSHGKSFELRLDGNEDTRMPLSYKGGMLTTEASSGIWKVFENGIDTSRTIAVTGSHAEFALDYHTIMFSAEPDPFTPSVNATASATYGGEDIASGSVLLGGRELIVTIAATGADSYGYAWSGGSIGTGATRIVSAVASLQNIACQVTGLYAPSISSNAFLGGTDGKGGTVGVPYSQSLAAEGTQPVTWSVESGTMPPGLTLLGNGTIEGTPTAAGVYAFTVRAQNGVIPAASKDFEINISGGIATLNAYKDGAPWGGHGKDFELRLNTDESVRTALAGTGGILAASVANGLWKVYDGGVYTETDIHINDLNAVGRLSYYTVNYAVSPHPDSPKLAVSAEATYDGIPVENGDIVLGGGELAVTVKAEGAVGYEYYWGGVTAGGSPNTVPSGSHTYTATLASTSAISCRVAGIYTATLNVYNDGSPWSDYEKNYSLKPGTGENAIVAMTNMGSSSSAEVRSGTWMVYDGDTYTGITIAVSGQDADATLAYYTATANVYRDGEPWAAHGRDLTLRAAGNASVVIPLGFGEGGEMTAPVWNGTWAVYDGNNPTGQSITINNRARDGAVAYMPLYEHLVEAYDVTLSVNKDGAAWEDHGKVFALRYSADGEIGKPVANGVARGVPNGVWRLFESGQDTGAQIKVNSRPVNATLNYNTVVKPGDSGASSGSGSGAGTGSGSGSGSGAGSGAGSDSGAGQDTDSIYLTDVVIADEGGDRTAADSDSTTLGNIVDGGSGGGSGGAGSGGDGSGGDGGGGGGGSSLGSLMQEIGNLVLRAVEALIALPLADKVLLGTAACALGLLCKLMFGFFAGGPKRKGDRDGRGGKVRSPAYA